jgi:uncharacterized protein DUF3224
MTGTGKAGGGFRIKAWDEQPYAGLDGAPKLTHARVTASYGGDLAGLRGDGGYLARHGEAEVAYDLRGSLA